MTHRQDRAWTEAMQWVFDLDRTPADPSLRRRLNQWLEADAANAHAYEQARLIWNAAPLLQPQRPKIVPMPSRRRFLATGGALAAGIALTWSGRGQIEKLWADHSTAIGERKTVDLADGSRMILNTDSAVRTRFGAAETHIDLVRGEIFVTLPPIPSQPLEITLDDSRVLARAGALNLRRSPSALVILERGEASLTVDGNMQTLAPGQEMRRDNDGSPWQRSALAGSDPAPWREGRLVVNNWPVSRVLDEIDRYHRGTIVLSDRHLGAEMVNGVYDLTRPADAVRAVAQTFGGTVRQITPYVLVVGIA